MGCPSFYSLLKLLSSPTPDLMGPDCRLVSHLKGDRIQLVTKLCRVKVIFVIQSNLHCHIFVWSSPLSIGISMDLQSLAKIVIPPSGLMFLTDTTQCRSDLYAIMGRRTPYVSGRLGCQSSHLSYLIHYMSINVKTRVLQTAQAVADTRLSTLVSPKLKFALQILLRPLRPTP